ncbi:type VI secretion system-associated protein TagF [Aquabacterium sp.]|uniref:type VI secretion system-associated protein TagF n=1 Tax=Aquabacterium sp. TaxID=1872578 RepID=UPI002C038FAF|nr:type VI secretion system-associated protein TagF [Aquabacterium sp.]HSW03526.1 type VI secretion system-associated protein TagF [Aquabacterium sp.]
MTGVYGKLPSYGDFVRRELPQSFVLPWDEWLQAGLGAARDALGQEFDALWAAAPPWRFRLGAGACGASAVAGVLLTSQDSVGRQFPLTLAALLPDDASAPNDAWYAALEQAGQAGRDQGDSVDALLATLPSAAMGHSFLAIDGVPAEGWWTRDGRRWQLSALPTVSQFRSLLQGGNGAGVGGGSRGERFVARAASHPGTVRTRNEDAFVDRGDIGLWAVADGAGGHGAGDVASAAVAAALSDLPSGLSAAEILAQVRLRLGAVHAELQRIAAASTNGEMPVTTVVVLMARGDHFACLWAGDSRAYLLRDGSLCQVTHDHSLVQELVEAGALAPEDAESHPQANVITRAVGSEEALELDKVAGRIQPGDVLLLCTDGLFKALPESDISRLLAAGQGPEQLLEEALRAGARDNVTALVVEV